MIAAALSACQLMAVRGSSRTLSPDAMVNTAAAQTVSALGTEIALGQNPTLVGQFTATPSAAQVTETPAFTTAALTATPAPATQTPTPAVTTSCTNQASFVRDVSIPDGSVMLPRFTFVKTWELKNTGTCTWDAGYAVVFAKRGSSMGGPDATPVVTSGQVKPGDSAQVSVTLHAPAKLGDYAGDWELRSADNQLFGTGPKADAPFYVKIKVDETPFSFASYTCSAKWSSGGADPSAINDLPCPGQDGDSKGFILPVQNPAMEDGKGREGPGWQVMPPLVGGGWIVGRFQPLVVPDHADFRATVSCHPDAKSCYVRFRVTYQVDNGPEQELGAWNEGYDGNVTDIIKDLNMVGGKSTAFNFYLYVSGAPDQSRGVWFNPQILKN